MSFDNILNLLGNLTKDKDNNYINFNEIEDDWIKIDTENSDDDVIKPVITPISSDDDIIKSAKIADTLWNEAVA